MGLLDRFLGDIARKSLRDAIDSATGRNAPPPMPTAPLPQQGQPQSQVAPSAAFVPELTLEQKLDKILASEFPSYQVAKNIDPRAMGATDTHLIPYPYVISFGGVTKLILMLPDRNTCSTRGYRFARAFAETHGIKVINFLLNSPNEESYIIDRLHQYL
ncbi:MAG: hypothetical protein K6A81_05995 [Clostridiales bacterium]|nr:hypothetical protein [Clostridiales bacterium]